MKLKYEPDGETITRFMSGKGFVRGIQGPIGSGKSVACCIELFRLAMEQENSIDQNTGERTGPKRVRSCVIRNTSPMLETTTMKTWLEWFPEEDWGRVRWRAPFRQNINIPELNLEWEIWFLALDRPEDVKKLLSFEFTNAWLNEARELDHAIVTAAISRVSRYPRIIDGGATRPCVIMDTNAPDEEHWWAIMSGQVDPPDWMSEEDRYTLLKPDGWEFYTQPPGVLDKVHPDGTLSGYELNPYRENAKYTDELYYTRLMQGQTRDWIRNMLQNKIGRIFSGRPVYRDFNEVIHIAQEEFGPEPNEPIYVGMDFGRTPAVVFGQDVRGQVRVFDEIVSRDMGASQFAPLVAQHINQHYPDFEVIFCGDPAGSNDNEVGDTTPMQIFKEYGMSVRPAWSNDPEIRIGAIQTQINTLVDGGRPGYLLSPACTYLVAAKKGGYSYKKDREEIDKKSIYSHVSDAEQYMALRMGYGKKLIGRGLGGKIAVQANSDQSLFRRKKPSVSQRRTASILSRGIH